MSKGSEKALQRGLLGNFNKRMVAIDY